MPKLKKTFTEEQKKAFVVAANPHQWYLTAVSLHEQALALWRNRGRGVLTLMEPGCHPLTWDDTNRATYLLAAFAMENMLKAFLVYERPATVADGYLKDITTHDLAKLAHQASLIPYRVRDRWAFEALAEGNESWARYPCGRNAENIAPEGQFTVELWLKYCAMMEAYAVKMRKLLTKGWVGPYGEHLRLTWSD